jgi:hypothetical protein
LKKTKRNFVTFLLVLIGFAAGFFFSNIKDQNIDLGIESNTNIEGLDTNKEIEGQQEINQPIVDQKDFDQWASMFEEMDLVGYEFSPELSNFGASARAMNKELSFNKREILTTTGKIDLVKENSTEKTFSYVNGSKIFTVAVMINNQYIGNDFQGSDWLYAEKEVYAVPLVMTYENIIVLTTLQDTVNNVDYFEAIDLSKQIINIIDNE